jgi:hypothetical protein
MYSLLTTLWLTLAGPPAGAAPPRRRPAFRRSAQRPLRRRLELELLESRCVLSSGLKLGPLVQVTAGIPGYSLSDEVEPYLAVNPTNPKNMVGTWTQDVFPGSGATSAAIGVAVTFNGGNTWKTGVIPGLTLSTGGAYQACADSWLSFAPNGDLYFSALVLDAQVLSNGSVVPNPTAILTEKSKDGGLTWSAPTTLVQSTDPRVFNDKDSITADPAAPGFVYAVWMHQTTNNLKSPVMFTRTTDGGQSWDAPRTIYDPGNNYQALGNQIVVSPDGTLTDFFDVVPLNHGNHTKTLSLVQSSDRGETWSSQATPVASNLSVGVTDPDTGQGVDTSPSFFDVAVDPHSGNLYAVWQDARFGNSQSDGIAFSMSKDGGSTWSAPIQVNQTPTNIPAGDQQSFLPSIAVAADGTVAVTYYDFRFNDANPGLMTDYWLVEARAGTDLTNPASWHNEARLTNASFDLEKAGVWAGSGFFIGDYVGLAAAGNSFDAFFSATNGTDPGDIYFRDPVADPSTPVPVPREEATAAPPDDTLGLPALMPARSAPPAAAWAIPGPLLASDALWQAPTVDAYFMDLARTSETTNSVPTGDIAPSHAAGLALPAFPGATDPTIPPPASVSGRLSSPLAGRAAHAPPDDWGTDVLTLADPSWDGEADIWAAG